MGLYVLLTLPAVIGLLATLQAQLSVQAAAQHQQQVRTLMQTAADRLKAAHDSAEIVQSVRQWLTAGQQVWLVNRDGTAEGPAGAPDDAPLSDVTVASGIRAAFSQGESVRSVRTDPARSEVLVSCLRVAVGSDAVGSDAVGSDVRVLVMVSDPAMSMGQTQMINSLTFRAVVFTWLTGTLCLAIVTVGVVYPLQMMSLKLRASVQREDRDDMLLNVSDRHDEVGAVASALYQLEDELQDRILGLERVGREASASVNLLTAVLESMMEGVIAIDQQQKIVFINPGARRLLSVGDVIGPGHRLYEAVRIPAFLETVEESLKSGIMQSLEYRSPRDQSYHVLVAIPILKGPHAGAVVVVRDITDVRRLEAMRRDFVSGVSHELKTPLTVIQACTETLLNGAMDDPEASGRFLRQIDQQSERLLQLIMSMLQLARVETGNEILHITEVPVHELVDDVLRDFRTVANSRSVTLRLTGEDVLIVRSDEQAVRTILSNLVDNAVKHTDGGGTVTVDLRTDLKGACVTVRDTGEGIPEELLERIFERFYRVERDRSRERGGSGLGLAIVKHLCQALKANISVRSRMGEGSEFTVRFPAERTGSFRAG